MAFLREKQLRAALIAAMNAAWPDLKQIHSSQSWLPLKADELPAGAVYIPEIRFARPGDVARGASAREMVGQYPYSVAVTRLIPPGAILEDLRTDEAEKFLAIFLAEQRFAGWPRSLAAVRITTGELAQEEQRGIFTVQIDVSLEVITDG